MEINAALTYAAINLKKLIRYLEISGKWDKVISQISSIKNKLFNTEIKIDLKHWKLIFQM